MTDAGFDAIVLAGGDARRLGGVDKPAQQVAGVPLLDRALAAVADARRIVVVGPRRAVTREVSWCREEPPGGGPVAAIAAALPQVRSDRVVVLAADLPWIAPAVAPLLAALEVRTAAVLIDGEGRRNVLAAAWRVGALRDAVAALGSPAGRAARTLYEGMTVAEVPDVGGWGADCDTWEDLHAARHRPAGDERSPT